MPSLSPCRAVTVADIATAPARFTNSVDLTITPEQLFEVLEDADAWPRWAAAITKVTWTSAPPIAVGTTRTVEMRGGLVGEEEFSLWDPPRAMAFHFTASTAPGMDAFAEHYDVVATPSGCRLTWTLAMWPRGVQKPILKLSGPLLNAVFASFLRQLRRYTAERFAS